MTIKAITFDYWQTLFRETGASRTRAERRIRHFVEMTGADEALVSEAHAAAMKEFMRTHVEEQRNLLPADAVRLIAQHCDVVLADDEAARFETVVGEAVLHHPPEPMEGVHAAVKAAAERVPIGIISDTGMSPPESLMRILDEHGLTGHFTGFVFSGEMGVSKPQRAMYEAAARQLGVEPHELLHIGDLEPTDIAGALNVGAKAALFAGSNDKYFETTQAHYKFRSWLEFTTQLPVILNGA